MKTKRL